MVRVKESMVTQALQIFLAFHQTKMVKGLIFVKSNMVIHKSFTDPNISKCVRTSKSAVSQHVDLDKLPTYGSIMVSLVIKY